MKIRLTVLLSMGMAMGIASGPINAQVLDEITVTAQKREQSLQEVGIAITALSGDQMDALGFTSAQQVTAMAPGVQTVQPNGEANYSIGIRGVTNSDFTTNVESPVALYVDEVYVSQMSGAGFGLFDMERVEILRGPQGTLFGRNATGGLAHFITRRPTQENEGYFKVTVGDYDQIRFEGAASGGLTENLSARLSIATHDNNGYVKNRLTGDNLNDANDRAARLQLLYQPSDELEILFNVRASTQDIATGFFENVSSIREGELTPNEPNPVLGYIDNDGDVYAGDYDDPGFNDLETAGYSATIKWAINDNVNLTSITDFSTVERTYIEDSDASPVPLFNFFLTTDAEQFTQELRFDGSSDTMDWVVGAYFLNLQIDDSNGAITDPFIGGGGTTVPGSEGGLNNPYTSTLDSISVFGQIEYELSDAMTLIAGARFINDDKDFDFRVDAVEFLNPNSEPGFNNADNIVLQATLGQYTGNRSDSNVAGRLQLNWSVNDSTLAYLGWNRGIKGGGFNAPIFPLSPPNFYDDATLSYDTEQLDAFEIGVKTDIGDIGTFNAAAYYYDYKDYQIFNILGLDTITVNSPDTTANGFEVEVQLYPADGWDLIFGAAYNDTETTLPDGTKRTPIQSPKWNVNGLARYGFPAFGGELALQADFVYRDDIIFALSATPNVSQSAYTVGNVSATYTSGDARWQISAFVHNVGDEEYQVQAFDLSGLAVFGMTEQYYGRPRWWGISGRYAWGN